MQVFSISPSYLPALRDALLHSHSILNKVNADDVGVVVLVFQAHLNNVKLIQAGQHRFSVMQNQTKETTCRLQSTHLVRIGNRRETGKGAKAWRREVRDT